jgi:hypothetical protein
MLLADGFSCRSQIEHGTGRRALHLAEALQLALRSGGAAQPISANGSGNHRLARAAAAAVAGAALVGGGYLLHRRTS